MALVFKIKLEGSAKPPIWRKVKVNENFTFDDLHMAIQILFGWENSHLYQFMPKEWGSFPTILSDYDGNFEPEEPFSDADTFPNGECYNSQEIKLNAYFTAPKQKITYVYDFGDDWEHSIELIEKTDDIALIPVCLDGKGTNLTDDCGGIWGFYDMVEAVNNPKHPEHKSYMEWLGLKKGEKWDVNHFDLDATNKILKRTFMKR